MKQENYQLISYISDLYEKSKDLKDKMFIVENEANLTYYKVTTKTEKLAIAFCDEYECSCYDLYSNGDEDDCPWNWWKGWMKVVNYDDLDIGEEVWDLDNHSFEWCKVANLLVKTENGFKNKYENKKENK